MTQPPATIEVTTRLPDGNGFGVGGGNGTVNNNDSPGRLPTSTAPVSPTPTSSAVKAAFHQPNDPYRKVAAKRKRNDSAINHHSSNGHSAVVFSTQSKYHPIVRVSATVVPVAIVACWLVIHKSQLFRDDQEDNNTDDETDDYYKFDSQPIGNSSPEFWGLVWTMITVLCLYMVILPKQVDVRSNGSIGIKTFLVTFQFPSVARAYKSEPVLFQREDFQRPRLKFESHPWSKVVVLRRHGKWDVTVSPKDPQGFIEAIEKVVNELEPMRTPPGSEDGDSSKPDLASA